MLLRQRPHTVARESLDYNKCSLNTCNGLYSGFYFDYIFLITQRFFERIDLHKVEDYGCCKEAVAGMSDANKNNNMK